MSNAPIISGARAQQALLVRASFAGLWDLARLCGLALCFSVCVFARGWGGTVYILSLCLCVCVRPGCFGSGGGLAGSYMSFIF